jgi:hypothetical protein
MGIFGIALIAALFEVSMIIANTNPTNLCGIICNIKLFLGVINELLIILENSHLFEAM